MEVGKTIESVTPCACSQARPRRWWLPQDPMEWADVLLGLLLAVLIGGAIGGYWR